MMPPRQWWILGSWGRKFRSHQHLFSLFHETYYKKSNLPTVSAYFFKFVYTSENIRDKPTTLIFPKIFTASFCLGSLFQEQWALLTVLVRIKMKRVTLPVATNFHRSALVSYHARHCSFSHPVTLGGNVTSMPSLHMTIKVVESLPKAIGPARVRGEVLSLGYDLKF